MNPVLYVQYRILKLQVFLATFAYRDEFGTKIGNLRITPNSVVNQYGREVSDEDFARFYKTRVLNWWFIYPRG